MTLEGVKKITGLGVPDFAGSVVAASNKFIAVFVEGAVGEGKNVSLKGFK